MCLKNYSRIIIPIIGLMSTVLVLLKMESLQDPFEPTPSYEVQMVDELYYTDETIQQWVTEVCQEAGSYEQKIDAYQYLLICGGQQTKDRYALALVDTIPSKDKMQVVYSLVEIENDEYNQGQQAPFMLVRVPSYLNLKLTAKQIPEETIPNYLSSKSN